MFHSSPYLLISKTRSSIPSLILKTSGIPLNNYSTSSSILEVPIEWQIDKYSAPPKYHRPYLISTAITDTIPHLGSTTFIAGNIIILYSFSVNMHAGRGYSNFTEIFECRADQASFLDELPWLIQLPHSTAFDFRFVTNFFLLPSGVIDTPNISDALLHYR